MLASRAASEVSYRTVSSPPLTIKDALKTTWGKLLFACMCGVTLISLRPRALSCDMKSDPGTSLHAQMHIQMNSDRCRDLLNQTKQMIVCMTGQRRTVEGPELSLEGMHNSVHGLVGGYMNSTQVRCSLIPVYLFPR